jgi:hypothetical protein
VVMQVAFLWGVGIHLRRPPNIGLEELLPRHRVEAVLLLLQYLEVLLVCLLVGLHSLEKIDGRLRSITWGLCSSWVLE